MRGDEPADDAVRAGEDRRAAGGPDAGGGSPAADRKAHAAKQRGPRLRGGVRPDGSQGARQDRTAIGADRAKRDGAREGVRAVPLSRQGFTAVANRAEVMQEQSKGR